LVIACFCEFMSRTRFQILLIALTCITAGCAELSAPEPVLEEICRADTGPECHSTAYAGTTTELLLLGEHFHPGFEVDLGDDGIPGLGSFSARVGDLPIEQLALVPDRTPGKETLAGVLPGGLGMGVHDVELVTPQGHPARLLDGLLIANPLQVVAVPQAARVPVGHTFDLSISFENLGGARLSEAELELGQEGSGSLLLPSAPAPFTVEAGAVQALDLEVQASRAGAVSVILDVQAQAGGVAIGPDESVRVSLVVQAGASLSISTWVSPVEVNQGEEFELVAEVGCQGETPALEVALQEVQVTGSGTVELGPSPSQLPDIPPGFSRTFRWPGVARSPGLVEITLGAVGREAVSGRQLDPVVAEPVVLQIQ